MQVTHTVLSELHCESCCCKLAIAYSYYVLVNIMTVGSRPSYCYYNSKQGAVFITQSF